MAIDWNFLQKVEGKENTTYIPMKDGKAIQNSGVTVGTGVDLGQQTATRFKNLGISEELIEKLKPFFGKTKDKAVKALEKEGEVTLSDEEVFAIDEALKKDTLKRVKSWYNKDNTLGQDWSDLSDRQQTVVLSTFYNHGLDGAPNFKKQVATGDWTGAIENLRNFYGSEDNELHTRRVKEAQYLAGLSGDSIDGLDGPQTEAAVEQFKNTVGVSTPDTVQPEQPQIGSVEYVDNLMQMLRANMEGRQGSSQTPSRSDTQPAPEEEQEETGSSRLSRALAQTMRTTRNDNEARLARTANEAQLEATAEEAQAEDAVKKKGSLAQRLAKALPDRVVTKSKVFDRPIPKREEPQGEQLAGGQDDSKDPIFGIF